MDVDRDEIAQGGEPDPGRWRHRLVALAVVLCVGVAIGGLGVRAWYEEQRSAEVPLRASLFRFGFGGGDTLLVTLRLRNTGTRAVTVDKAQLNLTGFDVTWSPRPEPRTVRSGAAIDIAYDLSVTCDQTPRTVGTARLRVRSAGEDPRWVEVDVPFLSEGPGRSADVASLHTNLCMERPRLHRFVELAVLGVRRPSGEGLALRVRLTSSTYGEEAQPEGLRLTNIEALSSDALRTSFEPLADEDAVAMPVVGDLQVSVAQCDRVQGQSPVALFGLSTKLASERGSLGEVPVTPDLEYADALLDYITDRCG